MFILYKYSGSYNFQFDKFIWLRSTKLLTTEFWAKFRKVKMAGKYIGAKMLKKQMDKDAAK